MGRWSLCFRCPGIALPVGRPSRRIVAHAFPPHIAFGCECSIRENAVAPQSVHCVGIGVVAGAGGDTEKARFRVDGIQASVWTELHPTDVVTNGLGLPAWNRRYQHCQVGLATCRRKSGSDVFSFAGRVRQFENQHVFCEPTIVTGHHRSDA